MSEEGNGLGAGISQDPGTGLQIGELNPLARKLITDSIYNKQSDDFFNSAKRVAVEQ